MIELNPDALEAAMKAIWNEHSHKQNPFASWDSTRTVAKDSIRTYLSVATPQAEIDRLREALRLTADRIELLLDVFPEPDGNSDHPGATRYVLKRARALLHPETPNGGRNG